MGIWRDKEPLSMSKLKLKYLVLFLKKGLFEDEKRNVDERKY